MFNKLCNDNAYKFTRKRENMPVDDFEAVLVYIYSVGFGKK